MKNNPNLIHYNYQRFYSSQSNYYEYETPLAVHLDLKSSITVQVYSKINSNLLIVEFDLQVLRLLMFLHETNHKLMYIDLDFSNPT